MLLDLPVDQPLLESEALLLPGGQAHAAADLQGARRVRARPGIDAVGDDEQIEVPVEIVVRETAHDAGAGEVQAQARGGLDEGPVAAIQVELVGIVVVADKQVEVPVALDVGEDRASAPADLGRDARCVTDVLEAQPAQIAVEAVAAHLRGGEQLGQPIAVDVPRRHAATGGAVGVEVPALVVPVEEVGELDAAAFGGEALEARSRVRARVRASARGGQRPGDELGAAREVGRGGAGREDQEDRKPLGSALRVGGIHRS